jgi:hypothetical protein
VISGWIAMALIMLSCATRCYQVACPPLRCFIVPWRAGKTVGAENFTSLMDDLESRVFGELPDDTWVYPGHGDDTTLGSERPKLGEWRERGW